MNGHVLVIGTGMMGSGIAAVAALHGNQTILVGSSLEKAKVGLQKASDCINEIQEQSLVDLSVALLATQNLKAVSSLKEAFPGTTICIEAISENLEAKQKLFEYLDMELPADVPIVSNTSGLRITDIAARVVRHPERTMTAHFWLPAHLVPLVEVVMWEMTSELKAQEVRSILNSWGKAPVLVRKDLPGQLANRILQAVIREAVNIVKIGLASPEDVDTAVKLGMGIRFPAWGPLEHIDAVGLDLCSLVQDKVLPELSQEQGNQYMRTMVDNGNLGYKSGKGFYDWSQKDMSTLILNRNAFIVHALKKLRP